MSAIINGDSPSITFSDGTTQASAGLTSASSLTAANLTGSRTIPKGTMPAGTILQTVSTAKTDTFSTASGSFVDVTSLSVSITPTSSSSKILVLVSCAFTPPSGASSAVRLVRDSTAIFAGDTAGSRPSGFAVLEGSLYSSTSNAGAFLDSPATTASTTYKIQMRVSGGTAYVNRTYNDRDIYDGRTASSITVLEIAV
jgi:hypothetical protein